MHLRHLRWEASPEPHPFIVPARIRAPESITPSVSDCFLLQTSFVVFVCIDYIMSSDKSQVFLMKRFFRILPDADLYPDCLQICSRSCTRAPVPDAWRHTDTRHYFCCQSCRTVRWHGCLILPQWKADQPDRQHTQNPGHDSVAAEIACAVQELSFHKASEIYTSTTCKRSGDQSDRSEVSREIKKHTQTNLSVFWQGQ